MRNENTFEFGTDAEVKGLNGLEVVKRELQGVSGDADGECIREVKVEVVSKLVHEDEE